MYFYMDERINLQGTSRGGKWGNKTNKLKRSIVSEVCFSSTREFSLARAASVVLL